jgi:hypothetical protein
VPCPILLASGFFIREFGMSKEPELSFFQQLIAFAALAGLGGVVNYRNPSSPLTGAFYV